MPPPDHPSRHTCGALPAAARRRSAVGGGLCPSGGKCPGDRCVSSFLPICRNDSSFFCGFGVLIKMPFETTPSEDSAIAALKQRLGGFETEEGRLKGLDYKADPSDIFIATTPKAGTTWMQQICHQLRMGKCHPPTHQSTHTWADASS